LEDAGDGEIWNLVAANMVLKNDRAVKLGYKPVHPALLEHLHAALDGHGL